MQGKPYIGKKLIMKLVTRTLDSIMGKQCLQLKYLILLWVIVTALDVNLRTVLPWMKPSFMVATIVPTSKNTINESLISSDFRM